MKFTIAALLLLTSFSTYAACTPEARADLIARNAQLEARKAEIEQFKQGKYINGEVTSAVGRDGLIEFYVDKLNKDIRILTSHADHFNRTCTK